MDNFQLTSKQITSLKALHRLQRDRKIADRVKAVVLLGSGWSVAKVAENDPVYFADAVHPQFNSIPAYGWIKRGKDKELKSNGGRKRVNINGASSLRLFKKLEAKHPQAEKIHGILDNASYYIY